MARCGLEDSTHLDDPRGRRSRPRIGIAAWLAAFTALFVAAGAADATDAVLASGQAGARLGVSLASGDVNGDGYPDLIAGAQAFDDTTIDEGAVFVFHGSAQGLPAVTTSADDADAVLIGAQYNAQFGFNVGSGDLNGDGYDDVIVGAWLWDGGQTDEGAVFVFEGGPGGVSSTPQATIESNQAGARLGVSVASAGDVNGDGYDDLIAGAYLWDQPAVDAGAAFVFLGSQAGITADDVGDAHRMYTLNEPGARLATSVDSAGDVNGDGYDDIVIGAQRYTMSQTDEGIVLIYHGSADGLSPYPWNVIEARQGTAWLGTSVAGVGDVNGDGFDDVLLGAPLYNLGPETNEGAAFLFLGEYPGIDGWNVSHADATIEGGLAGAELGGRVAAAGDVNGDGYADVAIGAIRLSHPETDEGGVLVFAGGPLGLASGGPAGALARFESDQPGASLGQGLASGDFDADGHGDVVAGAFLFDGDAGTNEGLVLGWAGAPRVEIDGGLVHSCTLSVQGGVLCWGDNAFGQVGDGTNEDRAIATPVSGLESGVISVVTGGKHTCALTDTGAVLCWGANSYGQLGHDTGGESLSEPAPVPTLSSGVAALTAGEDHTCALTTAGDALCWGRGDHGRLGHGSSASSATPVAVVGLPQGGLVQIDAGNDHTCAVSVEGGAFCWGSNGWGRLGDDTGLHRNTPVGVVGLSSGVAAVSAGGAHTCAVGTDGAAFCWGQNGLGQLGDGTTNDRSTPVAVTDLPEVVSSVTAAGHHSCALTVEAEIWCWGYNSRGRLGDGTILTRASPVAVSQLDFEVAAIGTGWSHSCAVGYGGEAACWGANEESQLGDGTFGERLLPTPVVGSGFVEIRAGYGNTCFLKSDGQLLCAGYNSYGALGDGTNIHRGTPTPISGPSYGFGAVAGFDLGEEHGCAVDTAGRVWCWGYNGDGALGDGTYEDRLSPVQVSSLPAGIASVAAGDSHSCALTEAGAVWCWGDNYYGQVGDGSTEERTLPVQVLSGGISAIAAGGRHTCALTSSGDALCWGRNGNGQLGDNSTSHRSTPGFVSGLQGNVEAISAGDRHTCAITAGGAVWCWGANGRFQIGDRSDQDRHQPTAVHGLSSGVAMIATGDYYSCATTTGGGALCWGRNWRGQLGDGTKDDRDSPTPVSGLLAGVAWIEGGGNHSCAITTNGDALCWGNDYYGQLAVGHESVNPYPVTVLPEPSFVLGLLAPLVLLGWLERRRRIGRA